MARFYLTLCFFISVLLQAPSSYAQMFEQDVERAGATYSRSVAGAGGPQQCWRACANDTRCKAWTWERPGIKDARGICSLKSAITPAQTSPCCVSGLAQRLEQQIELGLNGRPRHLSEIRSLNPLTLPNQHQNTHRNWQRSGK